MLLELLTTLWLRIKAIFLRRKLERDLDDEIGFHLDMRRQKLEREGCPAAEASAASHRRLGNPALLHETTRSLWMFAWLEALGRDVRYASRAMARSPVFTTVAVATLALGIAAITAIFSLVNGILLRDMPYEKPEDIYSIREVLALGSERRVLDDVNSGNILEWKQRSRSFREIAALEPTNGDLIRGSDSVHLHGLRASASLFPLLGIRLRSGRWFTPMEDEMGHGLEMVLTDALWRDQFGSDPGIVGQTVSMGGYPATVIGVLPPSFYFPKQEQLYGGPAAGWTFHVEYFSNLNLGAWERKAGIENFNFAAIGRLRPGVSRLEAQADLGVIEAGIAAQDSSGVRLSAELIPLKTAVVGTAGRQIWMLMAGATLILLIVCVNLAGLTLARNTARAREVAIRLALGAGRWTVLRQFTVEGLGLAIWGGALGAFSAYLGVRLLVRHAPITLPRLESVAVDGRVLLFSMCVALGAGLLFSLLPAFRLEHRNVEETLKAGTPNLSASRRTSRLHDLLAGSEITLCTVLLICALLLGQSLTRVLRDNAWLNEDRVVTIDISPSPKQYQQDGPRKRFYQDLLHDVGALPSVTSAGLVSALPLRGEAWGSGVDFAEIPMRDGTRPVANFRFISPGYDDAIGLALVGGRLLREADWGREVVLISESVARQYPGRNLIGMHLNWRTPKGKPVLLEVAGVVRDVRSEVEKTPVLAVYIPYWIWPPWGPTIVVRTTGDDAGVAGSVGSMMHKLHREVPVTRSETLRQVLDSAVASRRFLTRLGVGFAAYATFLAALGLYGVVSLAAARRRREIAIRMAIGASHPDVFRMVIVTALRLTLAGVAAGLLLGIGVERSIVSMLYEVRPAELAVYGAACAMVIAVGLLASVLPAVRAARTDPAVALRYE